MERQGHGFIYENMVCKNHNFTPTDSYTHKYDAYQGDIPVQIKCIKYKSPVDMGDLWRNSSKREDFILVVGFWDVKHNGIPNIVEEHILYIDHQKWNDMFLFDRDDDIKHLIKTISNDKSDTPRWKRETKDLRKSWNEVERLIQPRFKRDSKKQKRVQCSIPNKKFYSHFIKEYKWQKTENTNWISSTPNQT